MSKELIRVDHIKKSFGSQVILKDFSLSVHEGEVLVILGPSGCGKSTLLRCMNGLEPVDEGNVLFRGQRIDSSRRFLRETRQRVGMVFQSYELFPHKNVLQNVTLAPVRVQKRDRREAEAEATELLERVGLGEKLKQYPRELSGGQKQRVAIARTLAVHPEVILCDEVTAALDLEMIREVLDVLLRLAGKGKTMVIVTHEIAFAEAAADRVIFMEKGRIVEESRATEFFRQPKTRRAGEFLNGFSYKRAKTA